MYMVYYCVTNFWLFVFTVLCALGRCYHYQYKYMDAIRLLKESLSIYQKDVSVNDVDVIKSKCCV